MLSVANSMMLGGSFVGRGWSHSCGYYCIVGGARNNGPCI